MPTEADGKPEDHENTGAWVAALTSQAQRCSDEIGRRSTTQQTLEAATVSVSAALAGVVLTGHSSPLLLLVVPWLAAAFAHQWLDHHRTIHRIGEYLASCLEPQLQRILRADATTGFQFWEGHWRAASGTVGTRRRSPWRRGPRWLWTWPIFMLYVGVSAVVLVLLIRPVWFDPYSAATHGLSSAGIEFWPRLVWAIDACLVGWLAVALWQVLMTGMTDRSKSDEW